MCSFAFIFETGSGYVVKVGLKLLLQGRPHSEVSSSAPSIFYQSLDCNIQNIENSNEHILTWYFETSE